MHFFFYDTETSGSNVRHDQVLQFAAIETDEDLSIVKEIDIFCRPDVHVIPHPVALIVTGQKYSDMLHRPMSHSDMLGRVFSEMNKPNTIFIGHNIFRFDEEMMRHEFYKSLRDPYVTSAASGGRMDTQPLLRACNALRPEIFAWSMNQFGNPSFKLEDFATNNGIEGHDAHDALGDVRVNVQLARMIKHRFPELWKSAVVHSSRSISVDRLRDSEPFLTVTRTGPVKSAPVVAIARDPKANKDFIGFNLDFDPLVLKSMSIEKIADQYREERAESPLMPLRTNQAPIILPLDLAYEPDAIADIRAKSARAIGDLELGRRARDAIQRYKDAFQESSHVEDRLYGGTFFSDDDKALMRRYHIAQPPERPDIVRRFSDDRLVKLGYRDIVLNHPETLDPSFVDRARRALTARLTTQEEVPWLTLPKAFAALEEAKDTFKEPHQRVILDDYEKTIYEKAREIGYRAPVMEVRRETQASAPRFLTAEL